MKEIKNVHIAGAGIMGTAIAQVFALAGYPVSLYEINPASLATAKDTIRKNLRIFI